MLWLLRHAYVFRVHFEEVSDNFNCGNAVDVKTIDSELGMVFFALLLGCQHFYFLLFLVNELDCVYVIHFMFICVILQLLLHYDFRVYLVKLVMIDQATF